MATCFLLGGQYCKALPSVNPNCQVCAVTPGASASYGALIQYNAQQPAELNVFGCVSALTGNPSASSCGAHLMAEYDCESMGCSQCPDAHYDACVSTAAKTTCAAQAAAAQCANGPLTACLRGQSAVDQAINLVSIFCMR